MDHANNIAEERTRSGSPAFCNMTSCGTTLPASWYTSEAIYNLEKRGVFMTV